MKNKIKHKMKKRMSLLLIVAAFLMFAEYMPKVVVAVFEKKNLNRYQIIEHNSAEDGIHYTLSVAEKMRVLSAEDIRMSEIFVIGDARELSSQAPDLLRNAKLGVNLWKEKGILPMESILRMEEDTFERATYYTVCNSQNSNLTVNVWLLYFVTAGRDIRLFMDAETYHIYALSIPNTGVGDYVSTFYQKMQDGMDEKGQEKQWQGEGTDITVFDKTTKDQLLEYWANSFADELRIYYSAYYVSSSYVLPELCIVDFMIHFQIDDGQEEISVPYYVTFQTDVEDPYENGKDIYIGLITLREPLEQK
ncbi:MAG: hypothetical protein K2L07_07915 [Lachnospiraceae bacterium]|nr:hypothetical protein [Lachnospiraceae bacterium]